MTSAQRVAGPVDDGLEQLVPRPSGRGEPRNLVQEAQLLKLVPRRPRTTRAHRRRPATSPRMGAGALGARWDVRSATATTIQA